MGHDQRTGHDQRVLVDAGGQQKGCCGSYRGTCQHSLGSSEQVVEGRAHVQLLVILDRVCNVHCREKSERIPTKKHDKDGQIGRAELVDDNGENA